MLKGTVKKVIVAAVMLASFNIVASADGGTFSGFSPYSIFGPGDLFGSGTAYNNTMGGVGIASRNNHFINPLNPAAVTARDSLAMMMDFSLYQNNRSFLQGDMKNVNNIFNIQDIIVSFPIYRTTAMMVGIMPFSNVGFIYNNSYSDISDDVLLNVGDVNYTATGQGSIYRVFMAYGATFFKRLSLGAQMDYYFGNIQKSYSLNTSESSTQGISNSSSIFHNGVSGKFGVQYEQPIGSYTVTFGGTYSLPADISEGDIPAAAGIGLSVRGGKWMVELDYSRSDWSGTSWTLAGGESTFKPAMYEDFRAGFEFIPNKSDIRYYFKKCAYRAGVYYKNDYFLIDGNTVNSYGVTLGMTLPVFRWYNGITIGVEAGKRGSVENNLIRENYINFSIGANLFDIWFMKPKYE